MNTPVHAIELWHGDMHAATIGYTPATDSWTLDYAAAWRQHKDAFPLSPALPLNDPDAIQSRSIRWFLENLLPEGRALDIVAASQGISKNSLFGLIAAVGAETTGAFRFLPPGSSGQGAPAPARLITMDELNQRLAEHDNRPLVEWDGKVRMSVAGYQDKLLVYVEGEIGPDAAMYLPDYPLASTHILKPQPADARMPHMVANEHFCMSLARALGFPVAEVTILRTVPRPTLAVRRFDRVTPPGGGKPAVQRLHLIDGCQACDMPVSHKYERHIGSTGDAALYRDGVSLPLLFGQLDRAVQKSRDKLALLHWVLYQLVIGNSDAHGKNFSFFVHPAGLEAAPWYDLVSVTQYPGLSHELAMAIGDEFDLQKVKGYALADFAERCGLPRPLVRREARRLAHAVDTHAARLADNPVYTPDEQVFVCALADYVRQQARRVQAAADDAAAVPKKFL